MFFYKSMGCSLFEHHHAIAQFGMQGQGSHQSPQWPANSGTTVGTTIKQLCMSVCVCLCVCECVCVWTCACVSMSIESYDDWVKVKGPLQTYKAGQWFKNQGL